MAFDLDALSDVPSFYECTPLLHGGELLDLDTYTKISLLPDTYDDLRENGIAEFSSARSNPGIGRCSNMMNSAFILEIVSGIEESRSISFATVEHMYQSQRYRLAASSPGLDPKQVLDLLASADLIIGTRGSVKAKSDAKEKLLEDMIPPSFQAIWDSHVKVGVMRQALWQKFMNVKTSKNPKAFARTVDALINTGDRYLVEVCTRHVDVYWGVTDGEGENMLGRLLMEIRGELVKARSNKGAQ